MRMWMVNPKLMCDKHLLGEHYEIHKMIGNLRNKRHWSLSLTSKGFLEPQNALDRHNKLVEEMISRGMNHNSPLDISGVDLPIGCVDTRRSVKDLIKRCDNCYFTMEYKIGMLGGGRLDGL